MGQVDLDKPQHDARLTQHVLAQLVCLGSHTLTGVIGTCGEQHRDWSAHYRFYGANRVDPKKMFGVVRSEICAADKGDVVVAMDDTRLRKTGRKIHGVKYMRDPLGPPFHTNFIPALRFLQTSMALRGPDGQARMLPVDWQHAPLPVKPPKTAGEDEWAAYREQCRKARISAVGAQSLAHHRQWLNENGARDRRLWAVVDGSFTNGAMLKQLPENTTLVGRIRADAKFYFLPQDQPEKGRKRVYADRAPTPEALRQDDEHPWQEVNVHYGGRRRVLRAKRLGPVRWRPAGQKHDLQLIVLAPTSYRLSPNSKLLYRRPAYLICTDPDAPLEEVVQHYLWRWDIEVNFRDQKTLLGVGDAQVRTPAAVQNVTAVAVAAYAMLHLAAARCCKERRNIDHLPAPKWRRRKAERLTTMNLIKNLRHELWADAIHFSSFKNNSATNTKLEKCNIPLKDALFYTQRFA